jgi:BirA family biotin operon repressor/biotin-[acetyl-CoA-carboxylase] ligase
LSDGKFHSGTSLAEQLKVSRSSIWKGIAFLRRFNLLIHAISGRGYRWVSPIELLDKTAILSKLDAQIEQFIPRIDVVNVVPSTNDYLIQRLSHDIQTGTVCLAEGQTKGRGRMGREWCSPFGANIYFSLYWRFFGKLNDLSGLSLVVGLAVLEALGRMCPLPFELGIKWPNDIWYKNAKLAGILIESLNHQATAPCSTDMIIGIGLNVKMPKVKILPDSWADLTEIFGFIPSRNVMIAQLLNCLVPMLKQFEQSGFQAFTGLWSRYDLLAGKKVELSGALPYQIGIVQGVNERGELCVKIGNTLKALRYGDVTVRPH